MWTKLSLLLGYWCKTLQFKSTMHLEIVQMLETTQNRDTCLHRSLQTKEAKRVSQTCKCKTDNTTDESITPII